MKELSTKRPVCASFYCYTCVHSLDHLHVRRGHFEYGRTLAQAFAKLSPRPTAFVAVNDETAVGAQLEFQALGLRVPQDLSITGFDNVTPAWYDGPKLTTCAVPLEEIGAEAARFLYWRIEHPNATRRTLMLETELVEGETTGELKIEE